MRILLVSHPSLANESGAAQVALSLAAALGERGHDVCAWSPEPLPSTTRWWNRWRAQRRAIERFVATEGPFDVIDAPAISISPALSRSARQARIVARSTQPELLYLKQELGAQLRRRPSPRLPLHALHSGVLAAAIVRGWKRSHLILCQGALELDWMSRRFPALRSRLRRLVLAPPAAERESLAAVRRRRASRQGAGTRFLWIGRWTPHKGTDRLVRFLREHAATHPEDTFTIAGSGPDAERDVPSGLLREGRVRVVRSFSRAELPGLLETHDAGLFTSEVEGWGLCLNEMLEAGLRVYATPAGGVVDLAPFWGDRLRSFPPPPQPEPAGAPPDLAGYLAEFSWATIARRYEEDVLCG